jgi:hypothetical protein
MKFYLYTESMKDEDCVPIDEPLKSYEASDIHEAVKACIAEIPSWMNPKLEEYVEAEGWASISVCLDGKVTILELDRMGLVDI